MNVQEVHHHAIQMLHVKTKWAVTSVSAMKVFSLQLLLILHYNYTTK